MADKKQAKSKTPEPKSSKGQTVRERSQTSDKTRKRRLQGGASRLSAIGKKRLSGKRQLRIGKRRIHFTPKFLRNAWAEIRQVTWPGRTETRRLTTAVIIFSIIFGVSIALLDYGLDKLFKEVFTKK